MWSIMVNTGTGLSESQRYRNKIVENHGRGQVTPRSMDIARAVLLEPGSTYQSVADRFGVTRQRVGQIVRRLDVARRKRINAI